MQKIFVDHAVNLRNERSTAGFRINDLSDAYPGLYRFTKLLELIAAGIQAGDIEVHANHGVITFQ